MSALSYEDLVEAVSGSGVGVRSRTRLTPLGGKGDKVFPPTYGTEDRAETRYATERRRVEGAAVESVLLDSVASQANRLELALLEAVRSGELSLPVTSVDFRGQPGVEDLGLISSLEAPHRIFDALLRDSLLDGVMFRVSASGRAITEAAPRNAAAIFHHAPHVLLLGGWDSTGPKGGRGAKYERALTSEIVGLGVEAGVRTSSRIDPAGIEIKAGPVYEAAGGQWTVEEAEALRGKDGQPKKYEGGGGRGAGRPSQVNHGNITPSRDWESGGVTVDEIVATTVLSFIQLRRLRFPLDVDGRPLPDAQRRGAEAAARTAVAALGLAATVLAFHEGFDLRSRCVLYSESALTFELIGGPGEGTSEFTLDRDEALALVATARDAAASFGLTWNDKEVLLEPAPRLVSLIRKSKEISATGATDD